MGADGLGRDLEGAQLAEQLLDVGPFEHVRRQGAQRRLDVLGPPAHVAGAPAERLVEAEVHARRHGAEAVRLGAEVAAGELGRTARGVQVAHRRQAPARSPTRRRRGTPGPRRGRARRAATPRSGAARWLNPTSSSARSSSRSGRGPSTTSLKTVNAMRSSMARVTDPSSSRRWRTSDGLDHLTRHALEEHGGHHRVAGGVEHDGGTVVVDERAEHGVVAVGDEPGLLPRGPQPEGHVHEPVAELGDHVDDAGAARAPASRRRAPARRTGATAAAAVPAGPTRRVGGHEIGERGARRVRHLHHAGVRRSHPRSPVRAASEPPPCSPMSSNQ